jgi:hypothetical protein
MKFIAFFNYLVVRESHRAIPLVAAAALTAATAGCGGSVSTAGASGPGAVTHRDNRIVHQDCPIESGEKLNLGGDARPDVIIVKSGGREVCRALDMNFDGVWDSWVYRDPTGAVVRRENDYDRDGRVDEIAIYRNGVLVEKQRATTLVGRLDTWHFYNNGNLARTERDSDGDTQIDQWWEYPKADRLDCPLIHSDIDGDGHPDPGATVDVCGESSGYVPPEKQEKQPSNTFERGPGGTLPTEVEEKSNKPADDKSGGDKK